MRILGLKHSHDGNICLLNDGHLEFHLESEKNSDHRHQNLTSVSIARALMMCDGVPDVLAVSGWSSRDNMDAQYVGVPFGHVIEFPAPILGKNGNYFSSSHEYSHIFCSYGMSPFSQGQPCYMLNYEGTIGKFYEIDEKLNITDLGVALELPGIKYEFLFSLGDSLNQNTHVMEGHGAGRLMALASFSDRSPLTIEEKYIIDEILNTSLHSEIYKQRFSNSKFHSIGVETQEFKNLAGKYSDAIFERFFSFAKQNCTKVFPLLIGGGCGLNCDWNTRWKECGLFPDVFIPPVPNDCGSAIGTAIHAQFTYTKNAKISWSPYSGELFDINETPPVNFKAVPLDYEHVAELLKQGKILAWVNGRYEIGPRALGNRSLLAAPFTKETHTRLNTIKKRESYRPIAPICLMEEVEKYFEWDSESPYMLHFQKVKTDALKAVTHVDGTARIQTVTSDSNQSMYKLLKAFKDKTGYGVLCNTSLNFPGCGFINQMSDLVQYQQQHNIDGFVVNETLYMP